MVAVGSSRFDEPLGDRQYCLQTSNEIVNANFIRVSHKCARELPHYYRNIQVSVNYEKHLRASDLAPPEQV